MMAICGRCLLSCCMTVLSSGLQVTALRTQVTALYTWSHALLWHINTAAEVSFRNNPDETGSGSGRDDSSSATGGFDMLISKMKWSARMWPLLCIWSLVLRVTRLAFLRHPIVRWRERTSQWCWFERWLGLSCALAQLDYGSQWWYSYNIERKLMCFICDHRRELELNQNYSINIKI